MQNINRVNISGFRRLNEINLQVRPFMVLIGANGVGKTSMLDAFALLSASASGKLNNTLSELGGIANLLTRGKSKELSFKVDMEVPMHQPLEYELHLAPKGTGYSISKELLSQADEKHKDKGPFKHIVSSDNDIRYYEIGVERLVRPSWEHNPLETSLYQVPKMFRQPEDMRRILATATQYHALDVSARARVKLPQPMKPATLPGADGEDLLPYLYYLRESAKDRYDAIVDTLQAAFPELEALNFPPVGCRHFGDDLEG